jgi:glycerophosphoryl diester phosphodiesterase
MAEFDVVLTKDNVPVIYHDFSVCLQNATNKNHYINVGIHQLTFNEIKTSEVCIYLLNK